MSYRGRLIFGVTLLALSVLCLLASGHLGHAQSLLFGYGGASNQGGGGPPPTCTVNLSTKFNNKCSSIFMRR